VGHWNADGTDGTDENGLSLRFPVICGGAEKSGPVQRGGSFLTISEPPRGKRQQSPGGFVPFPINRDKFPINRDKSVSFETFVVWPFLPLRDTKSYTKNTKGKNPLFSIKSSHPVTV
jgi:hypothetical protein